MANWNEIRFHDNLKRERDRLADCPHITNTENETFRAVIDEILQAVMSSHPRPMGRSRAQALHLYKASETLFVSIRGNARQRAIKFIHVFHLIILLKRKRQGIMGTT